MNPTVHHLRPSRPAPLTPGGRVMRRLLAAASLLALLAGTARAGERVTDTSAGRLMRGAPYGYGFRPADRDVLELAQRFVVEGRFRCRRALYVLALDELEGGARLVQVNCGLSWPVSLALYTDGRVLVHLPAEKDA